MTNYGRFRALAIIVQPLLPVLLFGEAIPALDGNALRVFARFLGVREPIRKPKVRKIIFDRLLPLIKKANPSVFNQSVMELGALICRPRNPNCLVCPINSGCFAYKKNLTGEIPVRVKAKPVPSYLYGAAIIWAGNKTLITRREYNTMLGGLWEFPGGKLNTGLPIELILCQSILEQTGVRVRVLISYGVVEHRYSHFKKVLHAYKCELISKQFDILSSLAGKDNIKWIKLSEASDYPLDKATRKVIDLVKEKKESKSQRVAPQFLGSVQP